MTVDKHLKLLQKLYQRTSDGGRTWERTPDLGKYQLNFPNYSVFIHQYFDNLAEGTNTVISITDEFGEVIDRFDTEDLIGMPPTHEEGIRPQKMIEDLYEMARRQALGVDKALDDIISELDIDGDDLPF